MPDLEEQPGSRAASARQAASARRSLGPVRHALGTARLDAGLPQLLVSEAVAAAGADSGVLCGVFGGQITELARDRHPPGPCAPAGTLSVGDMSLPVTRSATTGRPEWLGSRAELASRFPKLAQRAGPGELACAVLPLRSDGVSVGILGVRFAGGHEFTTAEQDFLLELAGICARHLRRWTEPAPTGPRAPSASQLGQLVQALSQADSADEVASVIAEKGATAGAVFANIAVLDPAADTPARLYHASSVSRVIADRYTVIPLDQTTPLGAVLQSGGEVWHSSLADIAVRYPELLGDTISAGAAATASLALTDRQQQVIGALGLAWGQAQAFTEAQRNEIRVVARLAADALGRAQQLEAERAARQRTERLQRMMTALVASASLDEVKASVFQHGLLPFGASAARLVLADQRQPGRLMTVNAVGLPEPALTEWREFPLSAHSPSRKALATGTIVYVPSRAELKQEFPDAHLSFAGPDPAGLGGGSAAERRPQPGRAHAHLLPPASAG